MNFNKLMKTAPKQWGLRGDPYLWQDMREHLKNVSVPIDNGDLKKIITDVFHKITGKPIDTCDSIYMKKYAHGGMSSGCVCTHFWQNEAMSFLFEKNIQRQLSSKPLEEDKEIDNLINKVRSLSQKYPLKQTIDLPDISNSPLEFPSNIDSAFDKNIYLKHHLSPLLQSSLNNRYWVIQNWGGIRSLKRNEKNDKLLLKLDQQLERGHLTRDVFMVISSLSKVASFLDHTQYAIYDSRVIYALNWLLFKYTSTTTFFPQPTGRNADIARFELDTIFNLSNKNISYIDSKEAYHTYCQLMRKLALDIYGTENPYLIEMLLFSIAPSYIVEDISNSLSLTLK